MKERVELARCSTQKDLIHTEEDKSQGEKVTKYTPQLQLTKHSH